MLTATLPLHSSQRSKLYSSWTNGLDLDTSVMMWKETFCQQLIALQNYENANYKDIYLALLNSANLHFGAAWNLETSFKHSMKYRSLYKWHKCSWHFKYVGHCYGIKKNLQFLFSQSNIKKMVTVCWTKRSRDEKLEFRFDSHPSQDFCVPLGKVLKPRFLKVIIWIKYFRKI